MKDLITVYQEALKKTLKTLKTQAKDVVLAFLFPLIFCNLLNYVFSLVPGNLSFFAGFIQFIASMYLLTYYLAIFYLIIKGRPLSLGSVQREGRRILTTIWTLSIFLWLIQMLLGSVLSFALVGILIFLFANPLDEMVYLDGYRPGDIPGKIMDFYRVNGLHWFLPLMVYLALVAGLAGPEVLGLMALQQTLPEFIYGPAGLFGAYIFKKPFPLILIQVLHLVYFIFRGHLYEILAHSNPRKRAYMREWK